MVPLTNAIFAIQDSGLSIQECGTQFRFLLLGGGVCDCEQAVVVKVLQGRKIAVRNPLGPLEAANMIIDVAEAEIDDRPVIRRHIGGAAVHQITVEQYGGSGLTLRCDDASLVDQSSDRLVIDRP